MNELSPIQTVYNSYRFRSRLEARWAVFFDVAGIKYEYEPEGFHLPSGNYLPDFFVEDWQEYVEVKPAAPTYCVPRVYFAGRMRSGYRGEWTQREHVFQLYQHGGAFFYCGPFAREMRHLGSGDHELTFADDLNQIRESDILFALLEDVECYGTLVEIGLAHSLNKEIVIGFAEPTLVLDEVREGSSLSEALWFAAQCASHIIYSGDQDAVLKQFLQWLAAEHPLPMHLRLGRELASSTGKDFRAVYGDPVNAIGDPLNDIMPEGSFLIDNRDIWRAHMDCSLKLRDAAKQARSVRFEHGEKPSRK